MRISRLVFYGLNKKDLVGRLLINGHSKHHLLIFRKENNLLKMGFIIMEH